jgi:pseudaminic acid biosynthesis-associated methylase
MQSTSTKQLGQWQGDLGRQYTDRNTMTPEQLDALWMKNYGISRSAVNRDFLGALPKDIHILEVGCNIGNQLLLLQKLCFSNLHGLEIQDYALELARRQARGIQFSQGSAFNLPFADDSFDLVFTSGVLIHIAPQDLPTALSQIHRCAKRYIFGSEYYATAVTRVRWREQDEVMWKMDYAKEYLAHFEDLSLVVERRLPYLNSDNVDSVFLLQKPV